MINRSYSSRVNILILDAGNRVKLIHQFGKNKDRETKIVAADISEFAPALYEADIREKVPKIEADNYIPTILDICEKYKVGLLIPLLGEDLLKISKNRVIFENAGTQCMVSDYELILLSSDKFKIYQYLKQNGFPAVKTVCGIKDFENEINKFPVMIKPRDGCGSRGIHVIRNKEDLSYYFLDGCVIQEYIEDGFEIGVDVYVDMFSKEVVSIFAKKKIRMRDGETDKSISILDKKLFEFVETFVSGLEYTGVIDIDIIKQNSKFYIIDVNPRFGGGYLHAQSCGVDFTQMILNNVSGITNKKNIGNYQENIVMMKYKDVKIIELEEM